MLHRVLGVAAPAGSSIPLVVFAHAAGFCKEVPWVCVMDSLHRLCHSASRSIRAVAFDFSGHGDTPVGTADAKHWPSFAGSDVLMAVAAAKELMSAPPSMVIGVGHSMGGAAVTLAEMAAPGTFSHLELIEPIIAPPAVAAADRVSSAIGVGPGVDMHKSALKRRNAWTSPAEARAYFASRGMCRHWAPAVLDAYVEHGLYRPSGEGHLQLKCQPAFEANLYLNLPRVIWGQLPTIGANVRLTVGHQGLPWLLLSAPLVARRFRHGELVREEGSHFWPMEHPDLVARNMLAAIDGAATRAKY